MIHSNYPSHIAHHQACWDQAMSAEGFDAVLVHSGSPMESFLDDYVYAFRPNPHFLAWLPLTQNHDCVLLIRPGARPRLWYYQPVDFWHAAPASPESWWAGHFEIDIESRPDAWLETVRRLPGRIAILGDSPALPAACAAGVINPAGLILRLHLERTRKTAYEVACMRHASALATGAHLVARKAFLDGKSEYDINLAYLEAVRQSEAELPYRNIVALNEHTAVLHYQHRQRQPVRELRSFLIDAGACQFAYASDITRTYASEEGEFNNLVLAMDEIQLRLAGQVKAGVSYPALHLHAHHLVAEVLHQAGIIHLPAEDAVESGLSQVFFPHGLGHFIGLQTHDVAGLVDNSGNGISRPEGHPNLRLTRILETGNVLTIEPGLYFIPSLLAKWKEEQGGNGISWSAVEKLSPYGGIRVEDNVVVGEAGCENLTRDAFARI